jgi:hypothetical protein
MTEYKIEEYDTDEADKQAIREVLIGRKVVSVEEIGQRYYDKRQVATLDNGVKLEFTGNEGCGGCSEGHYSVDELNRVDNAIMSVEFEQGEAEGEWGPVDAFRIFVYAENEKIKLLEVTGHDNGYYGTGYYVTVRLAGESA